ncbi:MAG TPA: DUF5069 domain-containing protein [Candidatus Baltobacteraceae bacterium]|nr:DUF5069 domain-containing protein [Candidatus Baltobacteraceae bacterium]
MLHKDLTTSYPRSVRDEYLGVVQLGRAVDKGIALANGLNGEYNFDCPMDKGVFAFLGIDGNALLEVIKNAKSESEIESYLKPFVAKKSADEIRAFNDEFLTHGPAPGSDSEKYFLEMRGQLAPDRTDVTSWADLLDLDEKRTVPQRVAA